MKNLFRAAALALSLAAVASLLTGCGYNTMVSQREAVDEQWANVEAQYQRRADLIPNLVSTVQAYAKHEEEVYAAIAAARNKLGTMDASAITGDSESFAAWQKAQGELSSGIGRLLAIAEAYPELKASDNFRDLQSQLEGTENRIATARTRYNEAVGTYNRSVQSFPAMLYAQKMGFTARQYFSADAAAAQAPTVSFD